MEPKWEESEAVGFLQRSRFSRFAMRLNWTSKLTDGANESLKRSLVIFRFRGKCTLDTLICE